MVLMGEFLNEKGLNFEWTSFNIGGSEKKIHEKTLNAMI
jgi:hypothetical protein